MTVFFPFFLTALFDKLKKIKYLKHFLFFYYIKTNKMLDGYKGKHRPVFNNIWGQNSI